MARALRMVMCGRESIHPADIRTTHQNVQVVRDGRSSEVSRAIVIWDRVGGGLGRSKAVADNLGRYTQSRLEARWAAYFDRVGIAWQYEPVRFGGSTLDFRLVLDGGEAYAEMKPVSEFPMDVAQRMLGAGWTGDILILGREPRHAWRYRGDGWTPVDLAS